MTSKRLCNDDDNDEDTDDEAQRLTEVRFRLVHASKRVQRKVGCARACRFALLYSAVTHSSLAYILDIAVNEHMKASLGPSVRPLSISCQLLARALGVSAGLLQRHT